MELNERQTRALLINPQLAAAGWNLSNRTQVRFEVPVEGYDHALRRLREFTPTDDQFRQAFAIAETGRSATARYLLRELEHALRATQELRVDEIPAKVNLEHVYPKSPPVANRWGNHDSTINRLGNLALLARRLNDDVKNADFATKKPYYARSELVWTQQLTEYAVWDLAAIDDRQEKMARLAPAIWR